MYKHHFEIILRHIEVDILKKKKRTRRQNDWIKSSMFYEFFENCFDVKQNGVIVRLYWIWDDRHTLWKHERSMISRLLYYPIWKQINTWTEYFCYFKTLPISNNNCRPMISSDRSWVLSHKHELFLPKIIMF